MSDTATSLLRRWSEGDDEAFGQLVPLVYSELRRLARRQLSRERRDHTLQPTALVNEAFLRLVPQREKGWSNRDHFFSVCAQVMRQVLVDHARRRNSQKRGGGELRVSLDEKRVPAPPGRPNDVELLELDRALTALAEIDPRRARVVEMRYFAGMSIGEIGGVLDIPEWDVKRDWTLAKAWLQRRLRQLR